MGKLIEMNNFTSEEDVFNVLNDFLKESIKNLDKQRVLEEAMEIVSEENIAEDLASYGFIAVLNISSSYKHELDQKDIDLDRFTLLGLSSLEMKAFERLVEINDKKVLLDILNDFNDEYHSILSRVVDDITKLDLSFIINKL